jgi:hypothetical protein
MIGFVLGTLLGVLIGTMFPQPKWVAYLKTKFKTLLSNTNTTKN